MSRLSMLWWRLVPILLAVLILGFNFSTNLGRAQMQPLPDWSRPLAVTSLNYAGSQVPVMLDSGETLIFSTTVSGVRYSKVSVGGTLTGSGTLSLPAGSYVSLSGIGGKQAVLFWSTEPDGSGTIYSVAVNGDGQAAGQPVRVADGAHGYVARSAADGPVVLIYGADGLQLYRAAGNGWAPVGRGVAEAGNAGRMDAQVLRDGAFIAAVHMDQGEQGGQRVFLFKGTLQDGVTSRSLVDQFMPTYNNGVAQERLTQLALAADHTTGYLFFTVEAFKKGVRSTNLIAFAGPLSGDKAWEQTRLTPRSAEDSQFVIGALTSPLARPGQAESAEIAFLAPAFSRFDSNNSVVLADLRDGQLQRIGLATTEKNTFQPAYAAGTSGAVITFTVPMSGGAGDQLYLISTAPDFIHNLASLKAADVTRALSDTLFDLMTIIYPIVDGAYWLAPMLLVIAMMHLLALNWAERNPAKVFWTGVLIAAPIQVWVAITMFTKGTYTRTMPHWLAATPVILLVYLGIACLLLLTVLRTKPPGRHRGAFISLSLWAFSTIFLTSLLFGPFIRRG